MAAVISSQRAPPAALSGADRGHMCACALASSRGDAGPVWPMSSAEDCVSLTCWQCASPDELEKKAREIGTDPGRDLYTHLLGIHLRCHAAVLYLYRGDVVKSFVSADAAVGSSSSLYQTLVVPAIGEPGEGVTGRAKERTEASSVNAGSKKAKGLTSVYHQQGGHSLELVLQAVGLHLASVASCARALEAAGQPDDSSRMWKECGRVATAIGAKPWQVMSWLALSDIAIKRRDFASAEDLLVKVHQGLQASESLLAPDLMTYLESHRLLVQGDLRLHQGDLAAAHTMYEAGTQRLGDKEELVTTAWKMRIAAAHHHGLACVAEKQGKIKEALAHVGQGLKALRLYVNEAAAIESCGEAVPEVAVDRQMYAILFLKLYDVQVAEKLAARHNVLQSVQVVGLKSSGTHQNLMAEFTDAMDDNRTEGKKGTRGRGRRTVKKGIKRVADKDIDGTLAGPEDVKGDVGLAQLLYVMSSSCQFTHLLKGYSCRCCRLSHQQGLPWATAMFLHLESGTAVAVQLRLLLESRAARASSSVDSAPSSYSCPPRKNLKDHGQDNQDGIPPVTEEPRDVMVIGNNEHHDLIVDQQGWTGRDQDRDQDIIKILSHEVLQWAAAASRQGDPPSSGALWEAVEQLAEKWLSRLQAALGSATAICGLHVLDRTLYITRLLPSGGSPLVVGIWKEGSDGGEVSDDKRDPFSLLAELQVVLEESNSSMTNLSSEDLGSMESRARWWKTRLALDQRVADLLAAMGAALGPWKSLLTEFPLEGAARDCAQNFVSAHFDQLFDQQCRSKIVDLVTLLLSGCLEGVVSEEDLGLGVVQLIKMTQHRHDPGVVEELQEAARKLCDRHRGVVEQVPLVSQSFIANGKETLTEPASHGEMMLDTDCHESDAKGSCMASIGPPRPSAICSGSAMQTPAAKPKHKGAFRGGMVTPAASIRHAAFTFEDSDNERPGDQEEACQGLKGVATPCGNLGAVGKLPIKTPRTGRKTTSRLTGMRTVGRVDHASKENDPHLLENGQDGDLSHLLVSKLQLTESSSSRHDHQEHHSQQQSQAEGGKAASTATSPPTHRTKGRRSRVRFATEVEGASSACTSTAPPPSVARHAVRRGSKKDLPQSSLADQLSHLSLKTDPHLEAASHPHDPAPACSGGKGCQNVPGSSGHSNVTHEGLNEASSITGPIGKTPGRSTRLSRLKKMSAQLAMATDPPGTMTRVRLPSEAADLSSCPCPAPLPSSSSTLSILSPPSTSILLVLASRLHAFPWESIPGWDKVRIFRCPNLQVAAATSLRHHETQDPAGPGEPLSVNPWDSYYLLNPDGDLNDTQSTFEDWFRDKLQWKGHAGGCPPSRELSAALQQHNMFIYFGHGGGDQYLPSGVMRRMKQCPGSMLMGCSSGRVRDQGQYDHTGPIWSYLTAGCPAAVANLWDVTDRDIDRFSQSVLEQWVGTPSGNTESSTQDIPGGHSSAPLLCEAVVASRSACRLRYLIGGAPVCYGIPVRVDQTRRKGEGEA